jgi:hypothetical protein
MARYATIDSDLPPWQCECGQTFAWKALAAPALVCDAADGSVRAARRARASANGEWTTYEWVHSKKRHQLVRSFSGINPLNKFEAISNGFVPPNLEVEMIIDEPDDVGMTAREPPRFRCVTCVVVVSSSLIGFFRRRALPGPARGGSAPIVIVGYDYEMTESDERYTLCV